MQVHPSCVTIIAKSSLGGLRAEFLTIILRELFGEHYGLFTPTNNSSNLQINPLSQTILGHLKYFEFAGMMLAKVFFLIKALSSFLGYSRRGLD